jgi:uncharacterized RDD family membrane protein YckC
MKCPGCGYENLDLFEPCKHCGPPLVAGAASPGAPPTDPADDVPSLRFDPECSDPGQGVPDRRWDRTTPGIRVDRDDDFVEILDDDASPFRIDDDLFIGHDPGAPEVPGTAHCSVDGAWHHDRWPAAGADPPGPAFVLPDEEHGLPAEVEPIIDRDDEVPERYWAPEVAGLGRRALALLVDQVLLLAVLGIFFLGALMALQRNGLTTGLSLADPGLQASALPFALLAALLSFAYSIFFHGYAGRTPGKALVGIEVRTGAGGAITWGRAILRWLGAALGLACAGVGIAWALFEPRRRSWADLISGTVVARPQREPELEISRR